MASKTDEVLWALHDFEAEQLDEVSFKAGEKIVVVERDDEFSDGWYTGTNEAGQTGLFPFAYTTTDQALALQSKLASTHLQSGAEQAASVGTATAATAGGGADAAPSGATRSARRNSGDTDNFSIADTDAGAGGTSGVQSEYVPPSGGRAALAASAQRNAAQENASEREAEARRKAAAQQHFEQEEQRQRALLEAAASNANTLGTPRKEEAALASNSLTSISSRASNPARTAPVAGMNVHYESDDSEAEDENGFDLSQLKHIHAPVLGAQAQSKDASANGVGALGAANAPPGVAVSSSSTTTPSKDATAAQGQPGVGAKLSSPAHIAPASSEPGLTTGNSQSSATGAASLSPGHHSGIRSNSVTSETGTVSQLTSSGSGPIPPGDPHDWSVDEVIEWGRSKGWDDATVLSKFREHDITGDVLMEMDVVILKEIDIVAYGKRLKVANAIKELKRSIRAANNGGVDDSTMTPRTPGDEQRAPGHVQLTPRRESLPLHQEDTEQLRSPLYPPGSTLGAPHAVASAPTSATSAYFGPMPPPPIPSFGSYHSASPQAGTTGTMTSGFGGSSRGSITSASGSAGRIFGHGRTESADRPRSASGVSLTGSFGGGGTGAAAGWPRSGPLELGFTGANGAAAHTRTTADQGGSANGSARNLLLDGTTAANSLDGDSTTLRSREGADSNDRPGGPGFLAGLGRGTAPPSSAGKAARLSKTSDGTASPTASPNLRVTSGSSTGSGGGRSLGHGERTSFFGLGPRNRKPAPKEGEGGGSSGGKTGTLSRLGLGKSSSGNKDRTNSVSDLKDRISLPTSSPSYEPSGDATKQGHVGIGISGAGLGVDPSEGASTARTNGRPGHSKQASVGSVGPEWAGIGTGPTSPLAPNATPDAGPVMARIRPVDFEGWIKKKTERYGTWKPRYMALKGPDLVLLRDPTAEKIKGYVSMKGYKVIADENTNPGKYGFKILHEHEKPHYFSSDDPILVREWMKALMKSTIGRDHSFPVISSYNNATISLKEAQRMNPPPRPPSPTSRARVQRANARPNTQTLSAKDASVLMGLSTPSVPGRM